VRLRLALLSLLVLGAGVWVAQAAGSTAPTAKAAYSVAPAKAPPARALAAATGNDRRYALANGCYAFRSRSTGRYIAKDRGGYAVSAATKGAAEPFRMQATALGRYIFYGPDHQMMSGVRSGVSAAAVPRETADWRVDVTPGNGFRISRPSTGRVLAASRGRLAIAAGRQGNDAVFSAEPTAHCAVFPEVETDVSGKPMTTPTTWQEVRGTIDLHMHMMAFEFLGGKAHCGRPWSPMGAPTALTDCIDHTASNGCGAVLENVLYGNPARCHDPVGWPTFKDWPNHASLTHEQSYYKWVERAYLGGLRVFVNLFVENRALCELYPLKQNDCNEMNSVRLQNKDINEMVNYIDAQSGGPGRGWFRIAKDPFEARRIIASGKMAVIKGIEVSEPFDCGIYNDVPKCDTAKLDRELNEVYGFGVRQMELINKFDNALSGVAGDDTTTGVIVNSGNKYITGKYWDMQACDGPKDEEDKQQIGVYKHDENDIGSNVLEQYAPRGQAPIYPTNSSCNSRGLSELGEHAIRGLMAKSMIIDPDHLSVRGRKGVMALAEAQRYSGVVSSHSWSTPDLYPRVYNLGGVITPMQDTAPQWIQQYKEEKAVARPDKFYFGFGYGADENGFAEQVAPRNSNVTYPFKSPIDPGMTVDRQHSGQRVFDFNKDGVAMYGMFPDWWQDLRNTGGPGVTEDMARGAEAYLQMWERASGLQVGARALHPRRPGKHEARLRHRSAASPKRPAQLSRSPGLDLVRPAQEEPHEQGGGRARPQGQGPAHRQHLDRSPRPAHPHGGAEQAASRQGP
jgi:hypothetical protein